MDDPELEQWARARARRTRMIALITIGALVASTLGTGVVLLIAELFGA